MDTPGKRRRYERNAVILLALGFGLVGLDRWIISPLFPAMMADLDLVLDEAVLAWARKERPVET